MPLAWQHCESRAQEPQPGHSAGQLAPEGLKKWVHPAGKELEVALPGGWRCWHPTLPSGTQPERATRAPLKDTRQPWAAQRQRGDASLLCPAGFQHWGGAVQGAAPSPSSLARLWGSLLLFPCWGLGQVVFGRSQRLREAGRARCSLQQAKDGMGALQWGLGVWGTPKAEAEPCPAVLAVPCHTQCHVMLSPMLPGDHNAPG